MRNRRGYSIALIIALTWITVLYTFFFGTHPPIIPSIPEWTISFDVGDIAASIFNRLLDVLTAALIAVTSAGVGRAILQRVHPAWQSSISRWEQIAGEVLLGLGLLSVLIFLVGIVWLNAVSVLLLLVGLAVLARRAIASLVADIRQRQWKLPTIWDKSLAGFIIVHLLMALIMALTPPTTFDSLTYHLLGPELSIQDGRFSALPDNHFFGFPQQVQTLYAGQMALRTEVADTSEVRLSSATIIHWLFGAASLLALFGYGLRRFNLRIALLAVAFLLTATTLWSEFSWAYNDLPPIGYGMMAFVAFEFWQQARPGEDDSLANSKERWLVVAALYVGLAMSIKYTLLALGVAGGVYIMVFSDKQRLISVVKPSAIFVGVASLTLAPWLIRNFIFYDNPVYPFGPYTADWDALKAEWYVNNEASLFNQAPMQWLFLPLAALILGTEGTEYQTSITPAFWVLIPMLLFTWRTLPSEWKLSIKRMGVLVGGVYVFWMFASYQSVYGAQTRLYFVMFPLLALIAAVALDSLKVLPHKPFNFNFMVNVAVAILMVLTLNNHFWGSEDDKHFLHSQALPTVLGLTSNDTYLDENYGIAYDVMQRINQLPEGSTVVFFWETRSLYCDEQRITCLEDTVLYRWWHDRRTIGEGSAEAILSHYREQEVDYILVLNLGRLIEFEYSHFHTGQDKQEWQRFEDLLELEFSEGIWRGREGFELWIGEPIFQLYRLPEN